MYHAEQNEQTVVQQGRRYYERGQVEVERVDTDSALINVFVCTTARSSSVAPARSGITGRSAVIASLRFWRSVIT
jgi:hypothetical protein